MSYFESPLNIVRFGWLMMLLSMIGFVISIAVSYIYAEYFSLFIQVFAHISTIVLAGIFKVAAVAVMAANKEIQKSSFAYLPKETTC